MTSRELSQNAKRSATIMAWNPVKIGPGVDISQTSNHFQCGYAGDRPNALAVLRLSLHESNI